jgi:hypothetical protein
MHLSSQDSGTAARDGLVPVALVPDHRRWWSLLVVCLGVMMAFVNVSSTISALTAIQGDLHPSPTPWCG